MDHKNNRNIPIIGEQDKRTRQTRAESEVQQILHEDMDKNLMTKPWAEVMFGQGKLPELPEWFIPAFKKAVMSVLPADGQVLSYQLKQLGECTPETTLFAQVNLVMIFFNSARPESWTKDFDEYVERRNVLDKITHLYNEVTKVKDKELYERREFLLSLYNKETWLKIG